MIRLYFQQAFYHLRENPIITWVSVIGTALAIALSDEGKIETEITKCIKCCACVKECQIGRAHV